MYYKYDRIELENKKAYIIVDTVIYKDEQYLYLVSDDDQDNIALVKEEKTNNDVYFKSPNEEEFKIVMEELVKKNANKIKEILNGEN
ncbi:MAG TPA: hypothetical protein PLT65_02620 [Bacilli bacterium]|nr:hypothetical protein [Bacilli bacterium]